MTDLVNAHPWFLWVMFFVIAAAFFVFGVVAGYKWCEIDHTQG